MRVGILLVLLIGTCLPSWSQDRAAAVFSPSSFHVSMNSGERLTKVFTLSNSGLSSLEWQALVREAETRRAIEEHWNQPGMGTNNRNISIRGRVIRAVGGSFEILEDTDLRLTCFTVDPTTGFLYAQQDQGTAWYRYNTAENLWTELAPCPVSSGNNGGAVYLDGKIYTSYTSFDQMWIYHIATDTWTAGPTMDRTGNIATDGSKIYISGDFTLMSYDPQTQAVQNLPSPNRIDDNRWGGLHYYNGYLYHHYGDGYELFDRYHIESGAWQILPNIPSYAVLGVEIAWDTYFTLGDYGGVNLYSYDLLTNQWNSTITLPFEVDDAGLAFYGQSLYVIQGESGHGFAALRTGPSWVTINRFQGTIQSGEDFQLDLNFNTEILASGVYHGELVLETNDPVNPEAIIPITLTVNDAAKIHSDQDALDFGGAFIGNTVNRQLILKNLGSLPINVSDISSDHDDFEVGAYPAVISPGQEIPITIGFFPSSTGPISGVFTVSSDAGQILVNLSGEGEPPPVIEFSPSSFSLDLTTPATETETLTVSNTGGNTLWVSLGESAGWLSLSHTSFTVSPGASEEITLTINTNGLTQGFYTEDIIIHDNDPVSDSLTVPVEVSITGEPDIFVGPSGIYFSQAVLGLSQSHVFQVRNQGTGPLEITYMTSNHPDFSASPTSFTLEAGELDYFLITHTPTVTGVVNGLLTLSSNDEDATVTLGANTSNPAQIVVSTDPITTSVATNQQVWVTLPITNTGDTNLKVSLWDNAAWDPLPDAASDLTGVQIYYDRLLNLWPDMVAELEARGAQLTPLAHPVQTEQINQAHVLWVLDSSVSYWPAADLNKVQNWLINGGALFMEGANYRTQFNQILPNMTGLTGSFGNAVAPATTDRLFPHPITQGLTSLCFNSIYRTLLVQPPAVPIADHRLSSGLYGKNVAAVSFYGLGRVVASAIRFTNESCADNMEMGHRIFNWLLEPNTLLASPEDHTIPPGQTYNTTIYFYGLDLPAGTHESELRLITNDPANPLILIPTSVDVFLQPEIQVNRLGIAFEDTPVGGEQTRVFRITNVGGLPLQITDIAPNTDDYSAAPTTFTLDPDAYQDVVITFQPTTTGRHNTQLTVFNNDTDQTLSLWGTALEAPGLSTSPPAFVETVEADETTTSMLTITNSGSQNQVAHVESSQPVTRRLHKLNAPVLDNNLHPSRRSGSYLLADLTGVKIGYDGDFTEWSVIFADLTARGAEVTPLVRPTTDLNPYHILWINNHAALWQPNEVDLVFEWLENGGNLLLEGSSSLMSNLIPSGSGITRNPPISALDTITDIIFPHPATESIHLLDLPQVQSNVAVNAPARMLVDYPPESLRQGVGIAAVAHWKRGRLVSISTDLLNHTAADNQLFANQLLDWLARPQVNWVDMPNTQVMVEAGTSSDLDVTFNAEHLNGGVYEAMITVYNAHVPSQIFQHPVTLTVNGDPVLDAAPASLDFGTVFIGDAPTLPLTISNTGTEVLVVSDITPGHGALSSHVSNTTLSPGESLDVNLTFEPTTPLTLNTGIDIQSDGGNMTVPVTGLGQFAPEMAASPNPITADVVGGRLNTRILTVENQGDGPLEFVLNRGQALVIGDGATEEAVTQLLPDLGLSAVVVADDSLYEGDPHPGDFDLVILLDGVHSGDDMPLAGQTALLDYVDGGGGLILFEWITFEIANGRYETLAPLTSLARDGAQSGVFTFSKTANHPVTLGVPHAFALETGANVGRANKGTVLFTSTHLGDAVAAHVYGSGRVVQLASAGNWGGLNPLSHPAMIHLFRNAVNWTAGFWFHPRPYETTVPANSSVQVTLVLDALALSMGSQSGSISVWGNDPITPQIDVPITMNVTCTLDQELHPLLGAWPLSQDLTQLIPEVNQLCDP